MFGFVNTFLLVLVKIHLQSKFCILYAIIAAEEEQATGSGIFPAAAPEFADWAGTGDFMDNNKVFAMKLSKIYPLLVQKAVKKNRTKQEVDEVICWLTGYDEDGLCRQIENDVDYGAFFEQAPCMNPNCTLITGTVCGVRVETIQDPLMQKIRYLDKLIDELAKGRPMEKILRQ